MSRGRVLCWPPLSRAVDGASRVQGKAASSQSVPKSFALLIPNTDPTETLIAVPGFSFSRLLLPNVQEPLQILPHQILKVRLQAVLRPVIIQQALGLPQAQQSLRRPGIVQETPPEQACQTEDLACLCSFFSRCSLSNPLETPSQHIPEPSDARRFFRLGLGKHRSFH